MGVVLYPAEWGMTGAARPRAAAALSEADRRTAERALRDLPEPRVAERHVDCAGESSLILMPGDDAGTTYLIHVAGTGYDLASCQDDHLTELGHFSDVTAAMTDVRRRCMHPSDRARNGSNVVAPMVA